ncbi:MAG: anthranilate synthase component I [Cyanobacteria bacterium P01_F01_bin.150]
MEQNVLNSETHDSRLPPGSGDSPSADCPLQPWHWRSLPLNHRTGAEIFQALYIEPETSMPKSAIATLLESPSSPDSNASLLQRPNAQRPNAQRPNAQRPTPRYSICAGAPRILNNQSQHWTPKPGTHLSTLQILLARSPAPPLPRSPASLLPTSPPPHLPFHGGWLGWLGYDVAWEIETLPEQNADPLPFPVSFWYEPETFVILDHLDQTLWLAATNPSDLDTLSHHLTSILPPQLPTSPPPQLPTSTTLNFLSNQQDYEEAVRKAKAYIQAGDIFQTNLSLRFSTTTAAPSWLIYRSLQQVNPSPFSSYWHTPWGDVVSCSPERLVKVRDRIVETRPIAGTRPRGSTLEQDLAYEQELTDNRKENAEHIMLVDLERNDLGRVCQWGSVQVDELLTIESYSHVMHLVSNVVGTLAPGQTVVDVVRSLFPGGTITGCPKVRCMEIIEELEPVRRSLFYGSCGYLDQRGMLDLNILIRTLLCESQPNPTSPCSPRLIWGQVGAGIVADSQPTHEWIESLNKSKAQLNALTLANNFVSEAKF